MVSSQKTTPRLYIDRNAYRLPRQRQPTTITSLSTSVYQTPLTNTFHTPFTKDVLNRAIISNAEFIPTNYTRG